ncbi:enoyl-CoA hydratase-related protein [Xanthobacter sp. TB0136]|uniref:enoyl-CoA hydratase-related protein n=1 Tax=Xanthobacter sp. TB0136 TaxID=3459177 RepID=UPI00403908C2
MAKSLLITEPHPGVRRLTINRPDRRNALDQATYSALAAALEAAAHDKSVRAVVLTGAGGCFTAGNDLADFQNMPDDEPIAGLAFLDAIVAFPKPLVAAVEGFAVGIGVTMLLHCDLAYAGATTRFRLPFVNLGLCAEGGSSYLLPLVAGTKKAAELLLLGESFSADAARDAGIVNGVTEEGEALAQAEEKAVALAALPAQAVAVTKRLLRHGTADAVGRALVMEAEQFRALRLTPEAQAAFAAFFRK